MGSDDARIQEIREENDELQDQEQFEKSEEFKNQGFEYDRPLDDNPEHAYMEGQPKKRKVSEDTEAENLSETKRTGRKKTRRR